MLDATRDRIARSVSRLLPAAMRRFLKRQDGAAAVEFGMVALPFFGLMFAILQTALVFFASQSLEAAVAEASRQIMTGQVQQANYTASQFKTNIVCAYLAAGVSMFDCANGISVSVQTYTTFSAASTTPPVTNGQLDTSNLPYTPGGPGDIVVVQLYYLWPVYVSLLGDNLSNIGTMRLLVATSVFRNEPYQ